MYAQMFHHLYRTPVVMARIFMAYGPGQPDWKLIPATAAKFMRGEAPVVESPERLLDWVFIADVVDALVAIMTRPGLEGQVVDVGSGQLTAIRDVVERLRIQIDPGVVPVYSSGVARGNARVRKADLAATQRLTGWSPKVSLEDGLARSVAAMRQPEGG